MKEMKKPQEKRNEVKKSQQTEFHHQLGRVIIWFITTSSSLQLIETKSKSRSEQGAEYWSSLTPPPSSWLCIRLVICSASELTPPVYIWRHFDQTDRQTQTHYSHRPWASFTNHILSSAVNLCSELKMNSIYSLLISRKDGETWTLTSSASKDVFTPVACVLWSDSADEFKTCSFALFCFTSACS